MIAPSDIKARRASLGITQRDLAHRIGTSQPAVAAIESGARAASDEMLDRIESALVGRPSEILDARRERVLDLVHAHGGTAVFVFGSVARGQDTFASDIDLMVDFRDDVSTWDQAELWAELTEVLVPYSVDLVSRAALKPKHAGILTDARPL